MVVWLSWEATTRMFFLDDIQIDAPIMLGTAFISLACNIFNLIILGHMPLPCTKSSEGNFMDNVTSVYKPHGGHECGGHGDDEEGGHAHDHGDDGHDHGHDHGGGGHSHENLNISAAVVHVIGDML
jgi:Co/Zn/Cd efflux system component